MLTALVCVTALLAALLTFFSGFGLGTVLLPVFALVFPVQVAVAATAVVHLANNVFKLALMARHADRRLVVEYGVPAAIAAVAGAVALESLGRVPALHRYTLGGSSFEITPVKLVVAAVIVAFAALELSPRFERWGAPRRWVWLGGLVSGFFGGLSGHQGALRSAFLMRTGLTKEGLVATRAAGAVIVDASRLLVYGWAFHAQHLEALQGRGAAGLVAAATACALAGSLLGTRLLKAVTLPALRRFIAACLLALAAAMAAGLV